MDIAVHLGKTLSPAKSPRPRSKLWSLVWLSRSEPASFSAKNERKYDSGGIGWEQKAQALAMQIRGAMELATFAVSLRGMFAMRGPPSGMSFPMPVMAGASGGAATMGQIVVSAEWIAAIRHLVEIGAITAAGAAEALRVRGFTHAMAEATDLPPSVKDLLGEGPTTDGMKVTNASGAGVTRAPRHHVLPQKERKFFEQSGFKGELDIDNFSSSWRPRSTRRSTVAATGSWARPGRESGIVWSWIR